MKKHHLLYFLVSISLFNCKKNDSPAAPQNVQSANDVENITIFPASHPLNADISSASVDPNSSAILANIGIDRGLFPDFGAGLWEGAPIGIPFIVVGNGQPQVPVTFRANDYDGNYGSESDQGPFSIPLNAPIEGNGGGDSHVITIDADNGVLYELYNASRTSNGWAASSAAKFNLNAEEYRTDGWTSADAAGLPIFPCLVRYNEVTKGEIDHAIRFTLQRSKIYQGYVHPARHQVSGSKANNLLPFGAKLRLRANFDISGFSPQNQVILRALKKHGLILADVGSSMYVSGVPDDRWNNDDLKRLGNVKVSDFEVIQMGTIKGN